MSMHDYNEFTANERKRELQREQKELESRFIKRDALNVFMLDEPCGVDWLKALMWTDAHQYVPTDEVLYLYNTSSVRYTPKSNLTPLGLFRDELLSDKSSGAMSKFVLGLSNSILNSFLNSKDPNILTRIIREKPFVYLNVEDPTLEQTDAFLSGYRRNKQPTLTESMVRSMLLSKHKTSAGTMELLRNYCVDGKYKGVLAPNNRSDALNAAENSWFFNFAETKDEDLQKAVVSRNYRNYTSLRYPHPSVTECVVEKCPELIVFISDPSKKVVEIVKRLRPDNCEELLGKKKYENQFLKTEFYQFAIQQSEGYR